MKPKTYKTKQRDLVLGCISNSRGRHLTAEDIVARLQKKGTPVGKSTVYRYLNLLAEEGAVRKFLLPEGQSACYQYLRNADGCKGHYHLKCSGCGVLLHVECEQMDKTAGAILQSHHFRLDNVKTVLYGQCAKCVNH